MSEGFFSRWSRRKQAEAAAQAVPEPSRTPAVTVPSATGAVSAPVQTSVAASAQASDAPDAPDTQPLPTLDDAQALTPASDFQPFMQRGVGPEVRNAAMKKLFSDPHFNVMDGLDIYIDDYSQPDPMPAGMLRRMASAQFLKLVPEEPAPPSGPAQDPGAPEAAAPQVVAQSPLSAPMATAPQYDHPDLQLQPDPAAADPQPGPSAR